LEDLIKAVSGKLHDGSKFVFDWSGNIKEMFRLFKIHQGVRSGMVSGPALKLKLFMESLECVKEKFRFLGLLEDDVTWEKCKEVLLQVMDNSHCERQISATRAGVEIWAEEYLRVFAGQSPSTYVSQLQLMVKRLRAYDQEDVEWIVRMICKGLSNYQKEWLLDEWTKHMLGWESKPIAPKEKVDTLFNFMIPFLRSREYWSDSIDVPTSGLCSNYTNRVAAQVRSEMALHHTDGSLEAVQEKQAEQALEEICQEMSSMRLDSDLPLEAVIHSARESADPRFVQLRRNWACWQKFMHRIKDKLEPKRVQVREQRLYQDGLNEATQRTQQQPANRSGVTSCYLCGDETHTSRQCSLGQAIESEGIAHFDKDKKVWYWGSKDRPEVDGKGEKVLTPQFQRGQVASGI
jgi:hypothetical protein